jgi:putative nucleotidyltransferase with HDIG domain
MRESSPTQDVCRRLALYVDARRWDIAATVLRSNVPRLLGTKAATTFVHAFLDRLSQELEIGDRGAIAVWIDAQVADNDAETFAALLRTVCSSISEKYVAEYGDPGHVVSYFSSLSSCLSKRLGVEGNVERSHTFDPSKLADRNEIVSALLAVMDERDPATCEHSRAVGMWSGRIAKTFGLSTDEQNFAVLAGTLHDVGKLTTPSEILSKPGPLDGEEWQIMRAHARVGAKIIERIPALRDVAPIVRWHHERIDGAGYPDGLAGDDIPFIARIVCVADSFHAMISKRPYRKALPVLLALDELRAGGGTQWDRDVIEAVLQIVQPAGSVRRVGMLRKASSA